MKKKRIVEQLVYSNWRASEANVRPHFSVPGIT